MLLIDGVKYKEWIPEGNRAEDELEQIVVEHSKDIFSENSIYFNKRNLIKSLAGVGSIPDGLAIILGDKQHWHIVEVELSSHDAYQHVVPQVDKFINAVDNPNTRNKLIEVLYDEIYNDEYTHRKVKQDIGQNKDVHKFLSDLISRPPSITIIIEKNTEQLREALKKYTQKKVVEFRTYRRENAESAHVHLFEPLYEPAISIKPEPPPQPPSESSFEVALQPSYIESRCVYIPAAKKHLFPTSNTTLESHTDIGVIETNFNIDSFGTWLSKGLAPWFKNHSQLQVGDKVRITVIEPMKKYRLEIVK
jgi:hypothetical protein